MWNLLESTYDKSFLVFFSFILILHASELAGLLMKQLFLFSFWSFTSFLTVSTNWNFSSLEQLFFSDEMRGGLVLKSENSTLTKRKIKSYFFISFKSLKRLCESRKVNKVWGKFIFKWILDKIHAKVLFDKNQ